MSLDRGELYRHRLVIADLAHLHRLIDGTGKWCSGCGGLWPCSSALILGEHGFIAITWGAA